MLKIGDYLIVLAVAMVAVIITVALFRCDPILTTLQFALVLTVAAIPVAMPTVLSVTMALGTRLPAKKEAIVTRLAAIEELAGVDILCADKTGTPIQNKLTLGDTFGVNSITTGQVILNAALASRAENNDTIDLAVLGGLKDKQALQDYQLVHIQPFDPVHKRTEATVKGADGKESKVTKGVPQVILELSANAGQVKTAVDKAVEEFAVRGFRSLGVARAEAEGQWQFLGVLPLFDPPREDAGETIGTARRMGVKIKMVTGDALAIARETAGKYKDQPEAWNMPLVLGIATVLGVLGPVAAFGLFYLGDRVYHLDRPHVQTLMYLLLSVAGQMTIFLTRTNGPFWSIRLGRALLAAVPGAQILAILISVYGLFMAPLGWGWAGFVWGYALIWAILSDRVKLLAYRIFDPIATPLLVKKPAP